MISFQELLTSFDIAMIFGIVAIGIYVTFRTINFADLTCDGSFVTGAAVSAVLIKSGVDPYIATIASLVSGGLAGLLTGILNVKFKIADLLAGIIVAFMLYSVNLRIMNDAPSMVIIDSVTVFTNSNVSITIISLVLLFALAVICLLFSSFGLKLRSVGHNKQFSSIAGINIQLMTIAGVVISNSLVALGGGLLSQYQGFCDISQGAGTLVVGLTSVVIGEKLFSFKKEPLIVFSCLLGSILYRIFISVALHGSAFGVRTQDLNLITGIMIITIMLTKKQEKKNA